MRGSLYAAGPVLVPMLAVGIAAVASAPIAAAVVAVPPVGVILAGVRSVLDVTDAATERAVPVSVHAPAVFL